MAAASMLGFAISIHALREEGDTNGLVAFANGYIFLSTPSARRATMPHPHLTRDEAISIHALREEGDAMLFFSGSKHRKFLSTPSARRATAAFSAWPAGMSISIHALREEGDPAACR